MLSILNNRLEREFAKRLPLSLAIDKIERRKGLTVVCYHTVHPDLDDFPHQTDINAFANHLKFFKDTFEIVSLEAAVKLLESGVEPRGPSLLITFDDGYRDNLTMVSPLLEKEGVSAALFAASGLIRAPRSTFLNEAELSLLARMPLWSIGAHTELHQSLYAMSNDDIERELEDSAHWIKQVVGIRPYSFAYPRGKISPRVVAAARKAFKWSFVTERRASAGFDPHCIRRLGVWKRHDRLDTLVRDLASGPWEDGSR